MALQDPTGDPMFDWYHGLGAYAPAAVVPDPLQVSAIEYGADGVPPPPPPPPPVHRIGAAPIATEIAGPGPELGAPSYAAPEDVPTVDPSLIEMDQPAVAQMGFPHDPGPILDQSAPPIPPADGEVNPADLPVSAPTQLQPGLGIPAALLDASFGAGPDAISGGDLTPTAPGGNEASLPGIHADELTTDQRARQFEAISPQDQARQMLADRDRRDAEERARRDRLDLEDQQRQVENHGAIMRSINEARTRTVQLDADAKKLAETTPDSKWHASFGERLAGVLASIVGGLVQARVGGPNQGLVMIDQAFERQFEAQKMKMANQRAELAQRGASIQQQLALSHEQYEQTERYRLASYTRAQNQIASDMQLYDPKGKAALQLGQLYTDIDQRRAKALGDFEEKSQKTWVEMYKLNQKDAETDETVRHNKATEAAAAARGMGAGAGTGGAGGATNSSFNVASGFFDPFSGAPVFGKRAIGGKGEDAKERDKVQASIATYGHVQDYWAQLAKVGAKIGFAKTAGESVWAARKDTLGAEYDAAREALTVYLTKELGDKLTQGQLEAQAHRIPERASLFEARDPGRQIRDAQENADRDFKRDMNLVGIDADPIIRNAQGSRAPAPAPKVEDEVTAANEALGRARTPRDRKDAEAALSAAKERVTTDLQQKQESAADLDLADKATPIRPHMISSSDVPQVQAQWTAVNDAIDTYNQRLAAYHGLITKPSKGAKDTTSHDDIVAAAQKLAEARQGVERSTLEAQAFVKNHYFAAPPISDDALRFK